MKPITRMRLRGAIIGVGAIVVSLVTAMPLMGTAQDATPMVSEQDLVARGEEIYANVCIACHQPGGAGVNGAFPALNGNPLITQDDPTYVVDVLLNGRGGMPRFDSTYDDEEIAAIVTYIRQAWDNDAPPVDPELVAQVRAESQAPVDEATPEPEDQDEAVEEDPDATPEPETQGEAVEEDPDATPES